MHLTCFCLILVALRVDEVSIMLRGDKKVVGDFSFFQFCGLARSLQRRLLRRADYNSLKGRDTFRDFVLWRHLR